MVHRTCRVYKGWGFKSLKSFWCLWGLTGFRLIALAGRRCSLVQPNIAQYNPQKSSFIEGMRRAEGSVIWTLVEFRWVQGPGFGA